MENESENKNVSLDFENEPIENVPTENEQTKNKHETELNFFKRLRAYLAQVKWSNVFILSVLHILTGLGVLYFMYGPPIRLYTVAFVYIIGAYSALGMSVGAHRLWAHRSFKARVLFQLFLSIGQAMTMNGSAYSYARDHRTHHKYSDTDADPKNPSRGLIYSHIGWWLFKKSQKVKDHGAKLDFSDLRENWVVWYQHKFYSIIFVIFGVLLPTIVPVYVWQEELLTSFLVCSVFRVTLVLHHFFFVNSLAHFIGHRPYDYRIRPTEHRLLGYLTFGEGNHNYHHTFPYDYASSDKQIWESFNPATLSILVAHLLGQAYDLKKATPEVIEGTIKRTGIPACFDAPRGMCYRVTNGLADWAIGSGFMLYPVITGGAYQLVTGHVIFVW